MRNTVVIIILFVLGLYVELNAQFVQAYALKGEKVFLELEWTDENYGSLQWQQSLDGGNNWTDIQHANTALYNFIINQDAFLRVKIDAQEACAPLFIERNIKAVNFQLKKHEAYTDKFNFQLSSIDLGDAEVIEYGLAYHLSSINTRHFSELYHVKIDDAYPYSESFNILCHDLIPNTTYKFRFYFKTADGSLVYGNPITARTLSGLKWSTENWQISKNSIVARFESTGTNISEENISLKYGTALRNLKTVEFSYLGDQKYASQSIQNLAPDKEYLFELITDMGSRKDTLYKKIKTLSDYSSVVVDDASDDIKHTIEWNADKTLHAISPLGLQAEYPHVISLGGDTLLCSYHGGNDEDYWLNIYLQRSFDKGKTWTDPVVLMDKENSAFGASYGRFAHPDIIQLQNGWILMCFVGNGNPETNENCHVMVITSKDRGVSWSDPVIVGRGRTWSPTIVQLPNGELELFVASEAAWWGQAQLNQEILYSRSTDNGQTWTEFRTAAYSPDRRDGMPSALVMQGNKGLMFATETTDDQGWGSPSLVHRSLNGEWNINPWDGTDSDARWKVNLNTHSGAPYILQLPTGEIVLTAHTHGGEIWQTSTPSVVVGDRNGQNFLDLVRPIDNLRTNQGLYYNSLFLKDEETIWLVMTYCEYQGNKRVKGEIKYLEGKIVVRKPDEDEEEPEESGGFNFIIGSVQKITRVTGATPSGENLPNPNNTHELYGLASTDLGIIWEIEPGKVGLFFGDSFGGEFIEDPNGGPGPGATDWRSNVLAFSENTDLDNGIKFSGMATDRYNSRRAREIIPRWGYKSFTSIPTSAIEVGGVQYVHFMNWQVFGGEEHLNYSSIYRSLDKGQTWQSCESFVKFPAFSYFGQIGYAKKDGYVYMIGTPIGRSNSARLARFREKDILNYDKYQYWNGDQQKWIVGDESQATVILDGTVGELSVMYLHKQKRWLVMYFDEERYAICYRTATKLSGTWSSERIAARGSTYSQLYGSYLHPFANDGDYIYFTMSQWKPYNVFLMKAKLNKSLL